MARRRKGGELSVMEYTGLLTQDAEPGGTNLVDAYNGLNNVSQMVMLWTVHHCWPSGARFAFNFYRH